jgi:hypothetical protein
LTAGIEEEGEVVALIDTHTGEYLHRDKYTSSVREEAGRREGNSTT